jgi:hypothetical protein
MFKYNINQNKGWGSWYSSRDRASTRPYVQTPVMPKHKTKQNETKNPKR